MKELERTLWSLDPGDPHCGVALWVFDLVQERWRCRRARELTPDLFLKMFVARLDAGEVGQFAYEVFRLVGGQEAMQQTGSTFGTTEVIGHAKRECEWHGVEVIPVERGQRKNTLTRMRAAGWKFPPKSSNHVKDAIAVGARALDWRYTTHIPGDGVERL